MSESIQNILASRQPVEPPEIKIVQQFMQDTFAVTPSVTVTSSQVIIGVKGSALAGALRPSLHTLQSMCKTDKRLVVRIL